MVAATIAEEQLDGRRVLKLGGRLTIARIGPVEERLAALPTDGGGLTLDLSGVERIDTVGAWLVHRATRDRQAKVVGASPAATELIKAVAAGDEPVRVRPEHGSAVVRQVARIGAGVTNIAHTSGAALAFLGSTLIALGRALAFRRVRVHALVHQMEQVGVSSLPIVGLMSFLVGVVLAQQGAVQLQQFGLDVFVVNLVGRSTIRELGLLLAAIMVAGRSASAFAAQIGSMRLAEEVDAMATIGVSPMEALVIPRVMAGVIMMPLIGFFGAMLGLIGGGLFAWVSLNIPPVAFAEKLREVVPTSDFWMSLVKAPVFGLAIAIIGCFEGMQVSGNAESVGQRTTSAVVQSIFVVIVLDAFFAVFFTGIGFK